MIIIGLIYRFYSEDNEEGEDYDTVWWTADEEEEEEESDRMKTALFRAPAVPTEAFHHNTSRGGNNAKVILKDVNEWMNDMN